MAEYSSEQVEGELGAARSIPIAQKIPTTCRRAISGSSRPTQITIVQVYMISTAVHTWVAQAQQAVVQVRLVGVEGGLPRADPSDHGEAEVEGWGSP